MDLLSDLSPEDWQRQTLAPQWKIKDVAAHLLDGNLRALSMLRDGYFDKQTPETDSYSDLVRYLNTLNADWVRAAKRLSPRVIIDMHRLSFKEYIDFLKTLHPEEQAVFSVAWAGEQESKNWFHIAREYTEKWHHQQQIRYAVGNESVLMTDEYFIPYLDTSLRALPHHYRDVSGDTGDVIKFTFTGASDKSWYLYYGEKWELGDDMKEPCKCEVKIDDQVAWRIFTKGIDRAEAIRRSEIVGQQVLGLKIFDMMAVMA
ncbi:MAG: maleylpyruvate isomerase N-terminal domain-containing protein [Saprospiraceae bacterium]